MTSRTDPLSTDPELRALIGRITHRLTDIEKDLLHGAARARRIHQARQRNDASGAPAASARGSNPGAGRGGGAVVHATDESGQPDDVPSTGVEARAIALADGDITDDHELDQHHTAVETTAAQAITELRLAVDAVTRFKATVDQLANLNRTLTRAENGGAGYCLCCDQPFSGAPDDRGRRGLRPACYTAWRRAGCPDLTEFRRTRQAAQTEPVAG